MSQELTLSKDSFLFALNSYPTADKYRIAVSGGMDSCVLLHLFFSVKNQIEQALEAVYVNHGLNKSSDDWGNFCSEQCNKYGIDFSQLDIKGTCRPGDSLEDWARKKRYKLIIEKMSDGDILFTAHHKDDQVETFFLQALRGSGTRGLVSMPIIKKIDRGYLIRPLLNYSRNVLNDYAKNNNLSWCDDDSNRNTHYDRNYLRHNVLPQVEKRWPSYRNTITRLIDHQRESKSLLDDIAEIDMRRGYQQSNGCLDLDYMRTLGYERKKNLVLYWLSFKNLDLPNAKHVEKIVSDLILLETERSPCIDWSNVEVRRYKNKLYSFNTLNKHDVNKTYDWDLALPVKITDGFLNVSAATGKGISRAKTKNAKFTVKYRHGGEKIHPVDRTCSKTIKKLFQERQILPWYRDRVPLIYINDELAVIPGLCIDKKFSAKSDELSWDIYWTEFDGII